MSAAKVTAPILRFTTTLTTIGSWTIVRVPKDESAKLPSRGQAMVTGNLNGTSFDTPLEPDGHWSHWFRVEPSLLHAAHVAAGDTITLEMTPIKAWPDPEVPADLQHALDTHPKAADVWRDITPMARWEWVRWIRSTNREETRQKRILVACSKMEAGKRRPCCWNRNLCTEPSVSKNGFLLEPDA